MEQIEPGLLISILVEVRPAAAANGDVDLALNSIK